LDLCGRCRQTPLCLVAIRSAGVYDGALRRIVHAFKYHGCRALAAPLAGLMRGAGAEILRDATAVVPVPLSRRRAAARGFNQSDDLARRLGAPVWPLLRRRRHGPPQAGLGADARAANVAGAYGISWTAAALARAGVPWRPSANRLRGATLVIVDDVLTTGATVDACARVLLAAGAAEVRALTVARAVTRSPRVAV
jgi:ComF family protein